MLASKTLFVLLSLTALVYLVAGHEPCNNNYRYYYNIRTQEKCAAKCASYKGRYGECIAWQYPLSGYYGSCIHFYFRHDDSLSHPDGGHCGLNPVPLVNSPSESDSDEATGPEPSPMGCQISTYETLLGYAKTKESCESLCLGLESKRYSACLLWLWDEEKETCQGILVEDSLFNTCETLFDDAIETKESQG